jgi:hypothetical protein
MIVAPIAAWIDRISAAWRSGFPRAAPNHSVVHSVIGQVCPRDPLNAYSTMNAMGT